MSRLALILILVPLSLAACGGDDEAAPPAAPKPAGMSIPQYEQEVGSIIQTVNDARSDYFNGSNDRAAVRDQLDVIRGAYTGAVDDLKGIEPPAAAQDFQSRLVALWSKRANQVEKLAAQKPFRPARVSDLMYGTDRDGYVYDELYALPE